MVLLGYWDASAVRFRVSPIKGPQFERHRTPASQPRRKSIKYFIKIPRGDYNDRLKIGIIFVRFEINRNIS